MPRAASARWARSMRSSSAGRRAAGSDGSTLHRCSPLPRDRTDMVWTILRAWSGRARPKKHRRACLFPRCASPSHSRAAPSSRPTPPHPVGPRWWPQHRPEESPPGPRWLASHCPGAGSSSSSSSFSLAWAEAARCRFFSPGAADSASRCASSTKGPRCNFERGSTGLARPPPGHNPRYRNKSAWVHALLLSAPPVSCRRAARLCEIGRGSLCNATE